MNKSLSENKGTWAEPSRNWFLSRETMFTVLPVLWAFTYWRDRERSLMELPSNTMKIFAKISVRSKHSTTLMWSASTKGALWRFLECPKGTYHGLLGPLKDTRRPASKRAKFSKSLVVSPLKSHVGGYRAWPLAHFKQITWGRFRWVRYNSTPGGYF